MALINILAKGPRNINWDVFLNDYRGLNIHSLEVFPIPKELGFDGDSIGISVHRGYVDRNIVISELGQLIALFISNPYNLKFIELFDGIEVRPENVVMLINRL